MADMTALKMVEKKVVAKAHLLMVVVTVVAKVY